MPPLDDPVCHCGIPASRHHEPHMFHEMGATMYDRDPRTERRPPEPKPRETVAERMNGSDRRFGRGDVIRMPKPE